MNDISARIDQIDWVLAGHDAHLTDKQLDEQWEDQCRYRDWFSLEFTAAEQEYRAAYKQHKYSRDEWHRLEREKLTHKP